MSFVRGGLKFKGNFQEKLSTQQKVLRRTLLDQKAIKEGVHEAIPKSERIRGTKIIKFDTAPGSGRVVTSSRSVHGQETKFLTELATGDTLIFQNQKNFETMTAIVSMVFSDKSLSLKEPMASNVITYSQFEYKSHDKEVMEDLNTDEVYQEKLNGLNKKVKKSKTILEMKKKKIL